MADFNAGSIIGSLDVDRDPFSEGLELAKKQAQEFEDKAIKPTIEIDDEEAKLSLIDMQARADALSDSNIDIAVDVDDLAAQAQLDDLQAKVDELDGSEININTRESTDEVDKLGRSLDKANGNGGSGGGGMRGLIAGAIALAPALYPAAAAAVGFGVAAVGGFAQAAVAIGAFGVVAKSDFTDMQNSTKALAKAQLELETATTTQQKAKAVSDLAAAQASLVGPIGEAATAYANFQTTFAKLKADTSGPVFGVMTDALQLASRLLPTLAPLIDTTAGALKGAVDQIGQALGGPGLGNFLTMVKNDIVPDIKDLTTGLINFGGGFAKIFEAVNPLTQQLSHGVAGISQSFNDWATTLANGGIQPFLDYLKENGPLLSEMLKTVGGAIVHIAEGLAPLTGPALQFLTALGVAISQINIKELATAVGDLIIALIPLLPSLVNLINKGLDVLVPILEDAVIPVLNAFTTGLNFLTSGVMGDVTMGLIALAAAVWLVNIALDANPVTLVILALAGLIAVVGEVVMHWKTIVGFFSGLWNDVYGFFKKYGMYILAVLAPFVAIPLEIVKHWDAISGFFSKLWDDVTGFFQDHWKTILQVLADIILWPLAVIKHWDAITAFFSKLWGDVEKIFQNSWNAITKALTTAWGAIEDFFKALPGRIIGFFKDVPEWLRTSGSNLIGGLFTGIKNTWNSVISWFRGIPDAVKGWFFDAIDWLEQIGEDLIQGLWNGITSIWHKMTDWIGDAAGGVTGVLKKVWNILSPSRVMHEIGQYFGQGLHNGIIESLSPIAGDVEKYSNQIKDAMNPGKGGAFDYSFTGSMTTNTKEQAVALESLSDEIASLHNTVKDLPKATGDAVGTTVADKFTKATVAGAKAAVVTARQG